MTIELVDFIAQGPWAVVLFLWMRKRLGKQDIAIAEIRDAVCPHKPAAAKAPGVPAQHDEGDTPIEPQPV
jgi:hypothetical protein